MKKDGKPVSADEVAKIIGEESQEVSKIINGLKKTWEGNITKKMLLCPHRIINFLTENVQKHLFYERR
jgi:chromosome segregation and condensation protein ScpB